MFRKHIFDIVICDILMPKIDGLAFLNLYKKL